MKKNSKTICRCVIDKQPCLKKCKDILPDMKDVGQSLFQLYQEAKHFSSNKPSSTPKPTGNSKATFDPPVSGRRLIFHKSSKEINYCGPNPQYNWAGIGGRECRHKPSSVFSFDSCNRLCCGYGYMIIPHVVQRHCKLSPGPQIKLICKVFEEYKYFCKYRWMVIRDKRDSLPLQSDQKSNR